jgi:hypothetical protein
VPAKPAEHQHWRGSRFGGSMPIVSAFRNHANPRTAMGNPRVARFPAPPDESHIMNPYVCRVMSTICFIAGMISILGSIAVWWFLDRNTPEAIAHAERFGIFIGLWAPTLLILSNRFDRYADKARPLPGLDPRLDTLPDELPEEGY